MLTIAHSINPYLFQTGSWIYNQLIYSKSCRHVVLTTSTVNLDQFPFKPIYSTEDLGKINTIAQKIYRKGFNKWLPYWKTICEQERVDVFHSHFGGAGVVDLPLTKKLGVPHVVSFYGADMSKNLYYKPQLKDQYRKLFDSVAGVFVEGNYAKKTIADLGCPPEKIYITHLGVNLSSIKTQYREWVSGELFKILLVGTFTQKKGFIIALRAIEAYARNNPKFNFEISVIGDAQLTKESQATKVEILNFVNSTILKEKIRFYGFIPYKAVIEMSYQHHLFMQTSIWGDDGDSEGGFPVIITDMMATGITVIGSSHCDIPEIIVNGKNGLIAEEKSYQSTLEILKIVIHDYNSLNKVYNNFNKTFLSNEFDAAICAKDRETLYKKIALLREHRN